jgi:hypothetical protein
MKAFDAPLPIVDAQDAPMTIDEQRAYARGAYTNALNEMIDRVTQEFLLPADQVSVLYDIAQFATFLCAAKIVTARMQEPTPSNLMAAYWPMQKALKDEVPFMLRSLATELSGERANINDPI